MLKKWIVVVSLFTLFITFGLSVVFAYEVTEKKEGYPYNEPDNYIYFVRDATKSNIGDFGKHDSKTIPIDINVRNKEQRILSQDTITVSFKNLPLAKSIAKKSSQIHADAVARFDFNTRIPLQEEKKTPNQIWQEVIDQNDEYTSGTFYGRPALIRNFQGTREISREMYETSRCTRAIIYFNDITLPNAIATLTLDYTASITLGPLRETTQGEAFVKETSSSITPAFLKLEEAVNSVSIQVEKVCKVRTYDDKSKGAITVNTRASKQAGSTSVPIAILVILGGAAAGIIGAGAAGSSGENSNDKSRSSYSMVIQKNFGDSIKYNDDTVYVQARIVEHMPDGREVNRTDLTQNISVVSKTTYLEVSETVLVGNSMNVGILATDQATESINEEGVIAFLYSGAEGSFTNNVTFRIIGECYISLEKETLSLLAFSGQKFNLRYTLENFSNKPDRIEVNIMQKTEDFTLDIGENEKNETVIIAQDKQQKKPVKAFFETYSCEIIAENEKEKARTIFQCIVCYEGILPDFLGKKPEILAYQNDEEEMISTNIAIRKGIWDPKEKELILQKPGDVEITFDDAKDVFKTIGVEFKKDLEVSTDSYDLYVFNAEKPLPTSSPVEGEIKLSGMIRDEMVESKTTVSLVPDILQDQKNWEAEYQNCLHIINTYLPLRFRSKKKEQLEADKDKLGLEDLKLFRTNCWNIASRCILQEKESYMIESYWYDEAIATAELTVYVGDIALEIALTPFGGPITGFVVTQVKAALIDLISLRIERGTLGYQEMVDLVVKRLEQGAGQADGLIETPGFDKPKALAAWLACYVLYRIMYHWYFDMDEQGKPKGLTKAIESGLMDFAGKGASILLGSFAKNIADKRGISAGSTSDAEQKFVNENVSKAAKKGLDTLDKAADVADKTIADFIDTLSEYFNRIKSGGITFS